MAFLLICKICGVEQADSEFRPIKRRYKEKVYEYKSKDCNSCWKIYHKKWRDKNDPKLKDWARKSTLRTYGLTIEEYEKLYTNQNGRCAICKEPPGQWGVTKRALAVDHDHKTGKVRGLLCDGCNRALGIMKDNPEYLISAASYLFEHESSYVPAK